MPQQKHVLITGGAVRIGRVIALTMARAGWDITLHYRSSRDDAHSLRDEVQALGRQIHLVSADFECEQAAEMLIPEKPLKPITAIIHNASMFLHNDEDPTGTRHMSVNYDVPMLLNERMCNQLPEGAVGSVVHFLDNTEMPYFLQGYLATREKLRTTLNEIARSHAPQMCVNALALGPTMKNAKQTDEHFQLLIEQTPLKRQTDAQEVANAALFFAGAHSVTGQILNIDGGMHLVLYPDA